MLYVLSSFEKWAVSLSAPCYTKYKSNMVIPGGVLQTKWVKRYIEKEMRIIFDELGVPFMATQHRDIFGYVANIVYSENITWKYFDLRMKLVQMTESERNAYIRALPDLTVEKKQAQVVNDTLFLLPAAGITAWNAARAIYLRRCGLLSRYKGHHDAMSHIMQIARKTQEQYQSWEEFYTAYAVGECFASKDSNTRLSQKRIDQISSLMNSRQNGSYWYEWDMPLDGVEQY